MSGYQVKAKSDRGMTLAELSTAIERAFKIGVDPDAVVVVHPTLSSLGDAMKGLGNTIQTVTITLAEDEVHD